MPRSCSDSLLTDAGHKERALSRSADKIPVSHANLEKIAGDALDRGAVKSTDRRRRRRYSDAWRRSQSGDDLPSLFDGDAYSRRRGPELAAADGALGLKLEDQVGLPKGSRRVRARGNAAAQRAAITQNPCAPKRA